MRGKKGLLGVAREASQAFLIRYGMPREVQAPRQDQASCCQDVACDVVVMGLLACLYNADLLGAVSFGMHF